MDFDTDKLKKGGIAAILATLIGGSAIDAKSKVEQIIERVIRIEEREKLIWKQISEDIKEIKEDMKFLRRKNK